MSNIVQYGGLLVNYMFGSKQAPKWVSKVLKKVERKKSKLISNRDEVKRKLGTINRDIEKARGDVLEWLQEANKLIQELENLKLQRRVPSWNEFKKSQKRIKVHNVKCHFEPFAIQILTLERFSSLRNNFMCFKSIEKASDELFEALKGNYCSVIGLYGSQGSGKTTLVKAMRKKVEFLKIFYKVVFVTVSQDPNIRTIQDNIADSLDIILDKYTIDERAKIISSNIKTMHSRPLVIFDDVRAKLDLKKIGIRGCQVILTTRYQEKCDFIDCQKEIQLDPISTSEAWNLFEKHSGIHDEENSTSSELLNIARDVVYECNGLPGKIIKMGSSLKNKPIEEWQTSLDNLRGQIFLCFRGGDTRYNFTGTLFDALLQERFKVFMDDGGLKHGNEISSSLINEIETSRISIVVLSENFAYSTWCLNELVTILNCKKEKNQTVWPIFHNVEASDIRGQKNNYKEAMAYHEKRIGNDPEKVKKWRSALSEVAGLKGFTYKPRQQYEYKLIKEIVEKANKNRLDMQSKDMD